jgi:hypothetical protein
VPRRDIADDGEPGDRLKRQVAISVSSAVHRLRC